MFTRNEGTIDRDIRVALSAILTIAAIFFAKGIWMVVLGVLALVMLVTAAVGFCPLYRLVGINTCKPSER